MDNDEFFEGSGNTFKDVGCDEIEAKNLQFRSHLMTILVRYIQEKGFTQKDAAKQLHVSQPRISNLLHGKIDLFSVGMLLDMMEHAGFQIYKKFEGITKTKKSENPDCLSVVSQAFIIATNEIIDIFHTYPARVTLNTEFSMIMMKIYQNFMLDILPGAQLLIDKKKIYSFSIICRSVFDIIIQLKWILSLPENEKDKAIERFLNFEGLGLKTNGKVTNNWQKVIDPDYTSRKIAQDIGLDREIMSLPLAESYNIKDKKISKIDLTTFDYLSKVVHWNPTIINKLIGYNSDLKLGHTSEYLRMAIISSGTFISCAIIFTELFVESFFNQETENVKNKTNQIQRKFQQFLTKL
ncbi:XRE family transcriptional regulator [Fluoribacter dumoffii]|uniref:Uncharacterized conserved small protein n=1 Tax=Fluoribacter dumoffii TaxID=463 RepID=A0A377G8V3_9GAMM|nr:XRE family transcriptional regulator [Fluoribacter dumoffii]KTC89787.1 hypothetical protein Ldum_0855 [Fluoribacter dumoffii NY 23]STO20900.1 Uncharacterized conserved small protein [Fluoribacter dumoffii]